AGGEGVDRSLTVPLPEGAALAPEVLHPKAGAAEDAGAQALLETDSELDARQGALEAVAVDHVAGAGADLERQDLAGQLGGEGDQALASLGPVLGHEDGAARHGAAEDAEEAAGLAAGRSGGAEV